MVRSKVQGWAKHPACLVASGKEKYNQLLLWQCFRRKFWLPLHSVQNLILSVCSVSSQHAYHIAPTGAEVEDHPLPGSPWSWVQEGVSGEAGQPEHSHMLPQVCSHTPCTGTRRTHCLQDCFTHLNLPWLGPKLPASNRGPAVHGVVDLSLSHTANRVASPIILSHLVQKKNVFLVSTEEVQGLQSAPVQCSTVCAARGRANSETTPSSQSSARATNNAHRLSSVSLHYFIIYISSRYTLTIVCVYILQENEMEKRIWLLALK